MIKAYPVITKPAPEDPYPTIGYMDHGYTSTTQRSLNKNTDYSEENTGVNEILFISILHHFVPFGEPNATAWHNTKMDIYINRCTLNPNRIQI
jgi:hypothetical protein